MLRVTVCLICNYEINVRLLAVGIFYSETCLTWPPTVPEKVVNISKWSTYTNVSQNNFHARILFPANYLLMHIEIAQHIKVIVMDKKIY